MLAGGFIPRMTTKPFPRHGVTVQDGRELIALSAVKPLEASLRDGNQIGDDDRGLKPTANINRPSGTGDRRQAFPRTFRIPHVVYKDQGLKPPASMTRPSGTMI